MTAHRLILLSVLAGALTALPARAGYLLDSGGAPVRNNYGQCWRTGSWTPAQAIAECDPDLVKAPAERPAPVAEPPRPAPMPTPAAPPPSKGLQVAVNIREHHWAPIRHKGDEARDFAGFGLYTYVLFGYQPTDASQDDPIRDRYNATLAAVLRQSVAESSHPSAAASRGATNLFCLPATQAGTTLVLKNYDFILAQQYLSDFRFLLAGDKNIQPRLVGEAGPFLIATLRPLAGIVKTQDGQMKLTDAQAPILFIDLSRTHIQVINEMVEAFKREVVDTKMDRKKRFSPLRVTLIDLLKKADDQVTPIKEAVAGFMPKGEK